MTPPIALMKGMMMIERMGIPSQMATAINPLPNEFSMTSCFAGLIGLKWIESSCFDCFLQGATTPPPRSKRKLSEIEKQVYL